MGVALVLVAAVATPAVAQSPRLRHACG